jgi:hypothetical protein
MYTAGLKFGDVFLDAGIPQSDPTPEEYRRKTLPSLKGL